MEMKCLRLRHLGSHSKSRSRGCPAFRLALALCLAAGLGGQIRAAEDAAASGSAPHYTVTAYEVEGKSPLAAEVLARIFSKHAGTNVGLSEITAAAADLQAEYRQAGLPAVSVSIPENRITNGVVTLYVFNAGASAQILVSGRRYATSEEPGAARNAPATNAPPATTAAAATNAPPATSTNTPRGFHVSGYEVIGNTLLSDEVLQSILLKHTGTNVPANDIFQAASDLQLEYRDRGYPTVGVIMTTNQPKFTNYVIQIRVTEGRLSEIVVEHNHYFSSNNVMRALPGLRTNMMIIGPVFQAELDRANANQDRQISPQIEPGENPGETRLKLEVKDRLPLHGKVEFNNQSSPGTPDLRLNSSAVYNNLWQMEHSLGVQYSFSPEAFKTGDQWNFYDQPLVVNYSGFYRLPLGDQEPIGDAVTSTPGSFGYDEATRKFRLPPPSGRPELNLYASRSTIDTGVLNTSSTVLFDVPGIRQVSEMDYQQDLTINNALGFRLSGPLADAGGWHSAVSSGLDFKTYESTSQKTNTFLFSEAHVLENGTISNVVSQVESALPTTRNAVQYLPLSGRYDGSLRDALGTTAFGLGLSANAWHSGSREGFQNISGSAHSSGYWVTLTPSLSRDFIFRTNWVLSVRADGQWSSEPLISNEQFGAGGVNSVRGYHEGAVFGDTGWHISLEQKTPPHLLGFAGAGNPLTIRGSLFLDYAETYLLDPQGRPPRTSLWGVGLGGVAALGPHWEARVMFSVPLIGNSNTEQYQPFFNFSLLSQF